MIFLNICNIFQGQLVPDSGITGADEATNVVGSCKIPLTN